ncbi:PhzF family phenazine biosynthesis protein [Halomonas faecis]|uniref:PhzF family phenazine biosynthesis protein n=1 Tax=Halomonas faecis TaxID=1562110 RepID=UPI001F096A2C|nr:PhzF family phenazine biosynthesis protein [Halomonas faecis]
MTCCKPSQKKTVCQKQRSSVPTENEFRLRWFSPAKEVGICGHATLATVHVIFEILDYAGPVIVFEARSGTLCVGKDGNQLKMNFSALPPTPCEISEILVKGIGLRPNEVLAADVYVTVFDSEATVRSITPDHTLLGQLDLRGVIVTAPGTEAGWQRDDEEEGVCQGATDRGSDRDRHRHQWRDS